VSVDGSSVAGLSYDAADQVVGRPYNTAGHGYDATNDLTGTTTGQSRAYTQALAADQPPIRIGIEGVPYWIVCCRNC
jgi:hypothetical protein